MVKIDTEMFKPSSEPGIHYLEEPPKSGVLLRKVGEHNFRLITSLDAQIQSLYQKSVYESYSHLNLSNQHPDIKNRPLPGNIEPDPNRSDRGLHAFSIVASTGTIDEWRGQE